LKELPSRQSTAADARPFIYRKSALCCDRISLSVLAEECGTPLYVYSQHHIIERLRLFQAAFAAVPHTICYAVKANSSLALMKVLGAAGAGFDIVSGGELARVEKAARKAVGRTVFAGVGKLTAEIDAALAAGILLFNVESEAELALLEERARTAGTRARFSLRVNPDVFAETHPYISTGLSAHKFGIEIGRARSIYRTAARSKHLQAVGISVHIGSQIRAVEPFGAALVRVAELVRQLRRDGIALTHIDAGGGLGIEYGDEAFNAEAAVAEYARQIVDATAGLGVHLLLEPGRFLVAQAGALITRVVNVKSNGGKTFVITDAGMNDLIRPALYQAHHEIVPVKRSARRRELVVDVVGPVCESGDFFARDRRLPQVKPGDLLAVLDAGAYGMSLSSNYNTRARPAEVLVDGAAWRLVRRRETYAQMFAAETM
jgi:diaminopimelate decarboxylase